MINVLDFLVPKLIQLFTGQPPQSGSATPQRSASVPKERKPSTDKVSSETQTPTTSIHMTKKEETKLDQTISEFECQIQNMFQSVDDTEEEKKQTEDVESNRANPIPFNLYRHHYRQYLPQYN